jgi:hypothetical protein
MSLCNVVSFAEDYSKRACKNLMTEKEKKGGDSTGKKKEKKGGDNTGSASLRKALPAVKLLRTYQASFAAPEVPWEIYQEKSYCRLSSAEANKGGEAPALLYLLKVQKVQ